MADAPEGSLKVATPFGDIVAQGFQVIYLLAIAILTFFVLDGNKERSREHDKIECLMKLSIWVYTQQKGTMPNTIDMPPEMWACVPEFMVHGRK